MNAITWADLVKELCLQASPYIKRQAAYKGDDRVIEAIAVLRKLRDWLLALHGWDAPRVKKFLTDPLARQAL